ncbi:MAG TPA: hypothetical protein VM364_02455 [Vicinamibacterales bacterium]|nr:hypothetical protein [Vicinamibacterales bacterium]
MKLARTGIIAAAVLAISSLAFAQAKPDFSGAWTLDPEASQMGGAPGGGAGGQGRGQGMGMGGPMIVKQTADTLTVERTAGENKIVMTYKLDGTESVNKQTMGQMGEVEIKAVAKWDGDKLVITEKRPGRDGAMQESTQTWSLEGGNLSIERTGGRGASKQVYKKTT